MEIPITKTARKFGYIIWNSVNGVELERLLSSHERVRIILHGVDVGIKILISVIAEYQLGTNIHGAFMMRKTPILSPLVKIV